MKKTLLTLSLILLMILSASAQKKFKKINTEQRATEYVEKLDSVVSLDASVKAQIKVLYKQKINDLKPYAELKDKQSAIKRKEIIVAYREKENALLGESQKSELTTYKKSKKKVYSSSN